MTAAYASITKSPAQVAGSRLGTAIIAPDAIVALLGPPTYDWRSDEEAKVTLCWIFDTPRGPAEVRDYWWNTKGEWSIAAATIGAARFMAKHLRSLGVPASTRFNYAKDCKLFS